MIASANRSTIGDKCIWFIMDSIVDNFAQFFIKGVCLCTFFFVIALFSETARLLLFFFADDNKDISQASTLELKIDFRLFMVKYFLKMGKLFYSFAFFISCIVIQTFPLSPHY